MFAITLAFTWKTPTPPTALCVPQFAVQPPSTTTVWLPTVASIVRFLLSVSVPFALSSVIGPLLGQSTLKLIVSPLAAASIFPRSEPSPLTPLSVQVVTVSVAAWRGSGWSSPTQDTSPGREQGIRTHTGC